MAPGIPTAIQSAEFIRAKAIWQMDLPRYHFRGRYLGIAERAGWEFATRTNVCGVAVLIPVTADGEIVLVEQYRPPVQRRVIELPAGLIGDQGDPDEPVEDGAQRELIEETGYRAGRLTRLLDCPSTSGMSDEIITFFLAEELTEAGPGGGDESEDITVHQVPLASAPTWLGQRREEGLYLDPKVFTALFWLDRLKRGEAPCP